MGVYSEKRPWGYFEKFHENRPSTVKLLNINANARLSLQYHAKREEFWRIVKGSALIEVDDKKLSLSEGDEVIIPRGARHRIRAQNSGCIVLEISYGDFDEGDITRLADDYERV